MEVNIQRTRIVIIGGGAGGLVLTTRLAKLSRKKIGLNIHVTLIEQQLTHMWKPLLHEVACGSLNSFTGEIPYFSHSINAGYEYIQGQVVNVDMNKKVIFLAPLLDTEGDLIRKDFTITFDMLIFAVGSVTNDFKVPGVAEHCSSLDSRREADRLHSRLSARLLALREDSARQLVRPLKISIVGGGATGVELAAEIRSTINYLEEISGFSDISNFIEIRIIEAADNILVGQDPTIVSFAKNELSRLNVLVYTDTKVSSVTKDKIVFQNGKDLESDIHIWTSGVKAPPFIQDISGVPCNKIGQIIVNEYLHISQHKEIYALGDCKELFIDGIKLGPRAAVALQEANYLYKSIRKKLLGGTVKPFVYSEKGSLLSLGANSGTGSVKVEKNKFVHLKGHFAKLTYSLLYRRHQIQVLGWRHGLLSIIKDVFLEKTGPSIKLH